jgi:hypothetical protein
LRSGTLALLLALAGCRTPPGQATDGGQAAPDAAAPDASAPDLSPAPPCTGLDQASCDARTDCHGVFTDSPCKCLPLGCCAMFERCADGPADCTGPALCDAAPPYCDGPYVVSYTPSCYEGCARADRCGGCFPAKLAFTQASGCANDGSVEFCLPPTLVAAAQTINPAITCAPGSGRAMCDPAVELLCFFPTVDASVCVASHGALTDAAWAELCKLSSLPEVRQIVPTFFE